MILRTGEDEWIWRDVGSGFADGDANHELAPSPHVHGEVPVAGCHDGLGEIELAVELRVCACTTVAREVPPGPALLSTMRTLLPCLIGQSASTRPVGQAPTMRTSCIGASSAAQAST